MSYENEQELHDGTGADGAEGADDAAGADDLGGGDMSFAAGEAKKPVDKGTIVVVALLVACAGVLYFMYARFGPEQAVAAGTNNADQTINQFLSSSEKNVQQMRSLLQNTEKVVQQFKTAPPQVTKLNTDPFMTEKPKPNEDREAQERERKRQLLVNKIKESVDGLRLQTIIARDPKKAQCMINNTVYRKGNRITVGADKVVFTVEEIRTGGVTVTAAAGDETLTFELKMKQ